MLRLGRYGMAALFALSSLAFTTDALAEPRGEVTRTADAEVRPVDVERDAVPRKERRMTTRERRLARERARQPYRNLGSEFEPQIIGSFSLF